MSRPPINPEKTAAGIAVDPRTLERVVPESRRPDGSIRKQLKIRPGFTPQEDVRRFRGTKQAQKEANQLPKGHIVGWVSPSSSQEKKPLSKSAKKNAKRKEKRLAVVSDTVKDNWEDDDEEEENAEEPTAAASASSTSASDKAQTPAVSEPDASSGNPATTVSSTTAGGDLSSKMQKLDVK